jgi:predicted metal-dependent peptidase
LVNHYTNHYERTWSKIKNKYRHIAMFPGHKYYEKELAVVISIDQSGSMSDSDLEKINYVVSELAKKTVFTEILLHDTAVVSREKFTGKQCPNIRKFITNRVACGGTSHNEVFQILNEIRLANPKTKLIYLSFSDNYSDIEQVYNAELFRKITPYWITTDERNPVRVPGTQISLENGLLKE